MTIKVGPSRFLGRARDLIASAGRPSVSSQLERRCRSASPARNAAENSGSQLPCATANPRCRGLGSWFRCSGTRKEDFKLPKRVSVAGKPGGRMRASAVLPQLRTHQRGAIFFFFILISRENGHGSCPVGSCLAQLLILQSVPPTIGFDLHQLNLQSVGPPRFESIGRNNGRKWNRG